MRNNIIHDVLLLIIALLSCFHQGHINSLKDEILIIHSRLDSQSYDCVPLEPITEGYTESIDSNDIEE